MSNQKICDCCKQPSNVKRISIGLIEVAPTGLQKQGSRELCESCLNTLDVDINKTIPLHDMTARAKPKE